MFNVFKFGLHIYKEILTMKIKRHALDDRMFSRSFEPHT